MFDEKSTRVFVKSRDGESSEDDGTTVKAGSSAPPKSRLSSALSACTIGMTGAIKKEKASFLAASRICEYARWVSRLSLTPTIEAVITQSHQGDHPEEGYECKVYAGQLRPVKEALSAVETFDPGFAAVKRDLEKLHGFSEIGAETLVESFKETPAESFKYTDLGASLLKRVQDSKNGIYSTRSTGIGPWLMGCSHAG